MIASLLAATLWPENIEIPTAMATPTIITPRMIRRSCCWPTGRFLYVIRSSLLGSHHGEELVEVIRATNVPVFSRLLPPVFSVDSIPLNEKFGKNFLNALGKA